ncbi:MAG: FAD-dependent thymidylate synthase [Thiomicrorhabdus sp.]|jgi:thymidylate synthase (FAD)|nr:FAD-dependent thymidylate synthase [Thiomicrorhabdus sp.]
MELLTYSKMKVKLEQATPDPAGTMALVLRLTMHKDLENLGLFEHKLARYLLQADHLSPLEHVVYSFLIQGVSRSFLAQITRHRMSSFTSASQHYQDYSDYPCIVKDSANKEMEASLLESYSHYYHLVQEGTPIWEARQVLPNAAAVNIFWTINARSLVNFLRQRLCHRNVPEMREFANKTLALVTNHFPELFEIVGPQCDEGTCMQGRLKCSDGPWHRWGIKREGLYES